MEIRYARPEDLDEIIDVLKASLGEVSSKKNFEVWNFKHHNNPFGKSLVLVALEDQKIIGVRAFMKWRWQMSNEKFDVYRAVDTATHPDFRGRGIFKKLTLEAVSEGVKKRSDFIFNTPNDQSRPGYLKMGWEKVDKVAVELAPTLSLIFTKKNRVNKSNTESIDLVSNLLALYNKYMIEKGKLFTPKSVKFLKWRYLENPLQEYLVSYDEDFFCAVYIKTHRYFKELRISEAIFISKEGSKKLKKFINIVAANNSTYIISTAKGENNLFTFSYKGNLGPMLTIRKLNCKNKVLDNFKVLSNWNYSLGDLELF